MPQSCTPTLRQAVREIHCHGLNAAGPSPSMGFALTARQEVILTACLSCSWVHEFPGKCPRSSESWRRLRKEFGGNMVHRHQPRAMTTFVHGSNAIIVPRGLWYESKLNQTLGGSDPRTANPALNKMTVQANQFAVSGTLTLDAYLNARPVQQLSHPARV